MRGVAVATIGILVGFAPAALAEPHLHDGFYVSVSAGGAYYRSTNDGQDFTYTGGAASAALMIGGTVAPGLVLGGGTLIVRTLSLAENGYAARRQHTLIGAGGYVDYYLNPRGGGIHFQGFVGWAGVGHGCKTCRADGLTVFAGVGYDYFVSDETSLGGVFRLLAGSHTLDTDNGNSRYTTIVPALLFTLTRH